MLECVFRPALSPHGDSSGAGYPLTPAWPPTEPCRRFATGLSGAAIVPGEVLIQWLCALNNDGSIWCRCSSL